MSGTEIIFEISEDGLDGGYSASALDFDIHTQGGSLSDLRRNVRQSVRCCFEDGMDQPAAPDPDALREKRGPCAVKLPRDVSGVALVSTLRRLGYEKVRLPGPHVSITTQAGGEHHEVIPLHDLSRAKTLLSNLKRLARHHGIGIEDLPRTLDL